MDIYALLILARYIARSANAPAMPQLYGTLANNGVEITGLVRVAFDLADPEIISDTEVLLATATEIPFTNTPAGQADEFWAYDATSGGNRWLRMQLTGGPVVLVDGGNKTFAPGALTQTIETFNAA